VISAQCRRAALGRLPPSRTVSRISGKGGKPSLAKAALTYRPTLSDQRHERCSNMLSLASVFLGPCEEAHDSVNLSLSSRRLGRVPSYWGSVPQSDELKEKADDNFPVWCTYPKRDCRADQVTAMKSIAPLHFGDVVPRTFFRPRGRSLFASSAI
jgi:hypothetical protein